MFVSKPVMFWVHIEKLCNLVPKTIWGRSYLILLAVCLSISNRRIGDLWLF